MNYKKETRRRCKKIYKAIRSTGSDPNVTGVDDMCLWYVSLVYCSQIIRLVLLENAEKEDIDLLRDKAISSANDEKTEGRRYVN